MFQLNSLQSETLMIGPQDESVKITNRIDIPGINKDIWSVIDTTSNVLSCADNVEKFDTLVHGSTTQERDM